MIRRGDAVIVAVGVVLIFVLGLASACMDERAEVARVDGGDVPIFEVDPLWPKPLPNHWILGNTIGQCSQFDIGKVSANVDIGKAHSDKAYDG